MLRQSGNTTPASALESELAARSHKHWHWLVAGLCRALRRTSPRVTDQSVDDGEVFALQCAEGMLRAEFNDVMEAWASQA